MEIIGYIASVFIGIVLGVLGGGGSILSIPILVYIYNLNAITASAYSLFIIGITSLVGAIPKYREHLVNIKTGFTFGVPSIVTIFCTRKWVIPLIPENILSISGYDITKRLLLLGLFALLMVLASVTMIREQKVLDAGGQPRILLLIPEGVLIGFLTGLVGAGGGFLIIPALVLLTGLPFKTAVGTSLFIIAVNSLTGFLGDLLNYPIQWSFLLTITGLAVVGIFIGNSLSKKISATALRKVFGWFTLITGSLILVKEILLK